MLKGLVLMCGVFKQRVPDAEWNARGDPTATAMVYGAQLAAHRSIGLDVTENVTMSAAEVRARFQGPLLQRFLDFARSWFTHAQGITFHDPVTVTAIFDESICEFERGEVEIELKSDRLAGATLWTPKADGRHEIAVKVIGSDFLSTTSAFLAHNRHGRPCGGFAKSSIYLRESRRN